MDPYHDSWLILQPNLCFYITSAELCELENACAVGRSVDWLDVGFFFISFAVLFDLAVN